MKARQRTVGIGMILALATGMALAQQTPPTPLLHHTFENDPAEWTGFGNTAKVSLTHDAAHIKEGKGALQFDYAATKGEINVLVLPTPDGALKKMKALHFWIRADYPTVLAVALQEKEGGRYTSVFSVSGTGWQEVQLAAEDFILSTEENAPPDPDGKLDLDQVENLGIADYGQIFVQSDNADIQALLHVQKGPHTLYLDDFTVSAEALPDAAPATGKERPLDTPARPQVSWIRVGEIKTAGATGKPLTGPGLRADYHQGPGKFVGMMHPIARGSLKGMDQIAFTAAAVKPTKLVVQLEQAGGGKYRTIIDVPGGSEPKEFTLPSTGFEMTDDSGDRNGHFTPDQVNQILFLDASGLVDGADADTTLWINKLRTTVK